jgi:hypothetical protein
VVADDNCGAVEGAQVRLQADAARDGEVEVDARVAEVLADGPGVVEAVLELVADAPLLAVEVVGVLSPR